VDFTTALFGSRFAVAPLLSPLRGVTQDPVQILHDEAVKTIFAADPPPIVKEIMQAAVARAVVRDRNPSGEYFALDSGDHLYMLEPVFSPSEIPAGNTKNRSPEAVPAAALALETRLRLDNLRGPAVADTSSRIVVRENAEAWVP
jgi:hypothetical protein